MIEKGGCLTCINAVDVNKARICCECISKRRAEGRYINWQPSELYTAYLQMQAHAELARKRYKEEREKNARLQAGVDAASEYVRASVELGFAYGANRELIDALQKLEG